MMSDLEGQAPGAVSLLGVNAAGLESGNAEAVDGRSLPWLQDVAEVDAWGSWQVTWRDVVVVDAKNEVRSVFNLTEHDLHQPADYQALEQELLDAR